MRRIVVEELCEHGRAGYCGKFIGSSDIDASDSSPCSGGSRRELIEGEYVLIERTEGDWLFHDPGEQFVEVLRDLEVMIEEEMGRAVLGMTGVIGFLGGAAASVEAEK